MEDLKKSVLIKGDNIIGFTGRGVIPMTQEEFNALPPEKQLNGSYYITDGTDEIVISDNEVSENQLWSSQKISNELETKLDKEYITGITDANNAIGENGVNIFVMSASYANMPLSRTGIIRSYTTIEDKYIRVNQEYSTIDNSPQNGGTYKRYGASDDGGVTYTWSNWNFVGSIDDSTTAALKTWSSSMISSQIITAAPSSGIPSDSMNKNADNMTKSGFYTIGDGNAWTNLPVATYGILKVFNCGTYIEQQFTVLGGGTIRMFVRTSINAGTSWVAWKEYTLA